ncbi:MAG TPA: hypothetical protein VE398_10580 [Acidobacteriota bacterium]|nr:hypothetical protein [Acidobacteriota bacterium]
MKKAALLISMFCIAAFAVAGFKPKNIRPKKPEQYQARVSVGNVTYAADLLLEGKDQKDFFYKELTPAGVIAVRLAIFNNSNDEVVLPDGVQLIGPAGKEVQPVAPQAVAQAVLGGFPVTAEVKEKESPIKVGPNVRAGDPRTDRADPRYDPRLDPNDPSYDPTDPRNRRYNDPRYNDPNYDPRYGGYGRPGIIVSPRVGGGGRDSAGISQFEKQLVEKDFSDKAHSTDPVDGKMIRDRFLYFAMSDRPVTDKGFTLRIPKSKCIPEEIVLKF